MIEKLNWDSEFFGYPVGKHYVETPESFDEEAFVKAASAYKLVYIFAEKPLNYSRFALPADVKLTFQKLLKSQIPETQLQLFKSDLHDYADLQKLAFQSGEYSRFRTDLNFDPKDFYRMYEIWIRKSLDSEQSVVLLEEVDDQLAGFVTFDFNDSERATIGLIAVDSQVRGEGIGRKLMAQAEFAAFKAGKKQLRVATQQKNRLAKSFYKKLGYTLVDQIIIYHYWNV
ncbi:MAG: GNAT family N-acetyltransferase [Bacteroidales bacterium]|jgi:dTDP-4-amino-4,6-dideoxy-D-galactose acyltransferase|nr:GNAT family N-acetyltransferase [Bacteroidales bacterium]